MDQLWKMVASSGVTNMLSHLNKLLLLVVFSCASANASDLNAWSLKHGGSDGSKYRFAEQYGSHKNLLNDEPLRKQRLDFTYSQQNGWLMYVTTHLLAGRNDLVVLYIDDKKKVFSGKGCCHKQAFLIDAPTLELLRNASSISIEEIYYSDDAQTDVWFHYKSTFSTNGLNDALDWVANL